jgi:hypothetical protein
MRHLSSYVPMFRHASVLWNRYFRAGIETVSGTNPVNHVLRSLPTAEYERLLPHMEPVSLRQNNVLSDVAALIGHGYFLESGLVAG